MKSVRIEDWGKDHWSLLAYLETLCVDSHLKGVGTLDKRRMRCNGKRHPMHDVNKNMGVGAWSPDYGSRLAGFWDSMGKMVPERQIKSHDDWDCLNDIEKAGLIEVISEANGFVKLTEKGMKIVGELRSYKAKGGMYSGFRWVQPAEIKP
jgi:hypothetical protein